MIEKLSTIFINSRGDNAKFYNMMAWCLYNKGNYFDVHNLIFSIQTFLSYIFLICFANSFNKSQRKYIQPFNQEQLPWQLPAST